MNDMQTNGKLSEEIMKIYAYETPHQEYEEEKA